MNGSSEVPGRPRDGRAELPYREMPTEFVVCKPLDAIAEGKEASLVLMYVNQDQLSALVTLARFRRGAVETTASPWGSHVSVHPVRPRGSGTREPRAES